MSPGVRAPAAAAGCSCRRRGGGGRAAELRVPLGALGAAGPVLHRGDTRVEYTASGRGAERGSGNDRESGIGGQAGRTRAAQRYRATDSERLDAIVDSDQAHQRAARVDRRRFTDSRAPTTNNDTSKSQARLSIRPERAEGMDGPGCPAGRRPERAEESEQGGNVTIGNVFISH